MAEVIENQKKMTTVEKTEGKTAIFPPKFSTQLKESFSTYWKTILIPGWQDERLKKKTPSPTPVHNQSQNSHAIWTHIRKSPLALLGIIIIFIIISWVIFAPWISPYIFGRLIRKASDSYKTPSPEHWLGTTAMGRDVFHRLIWGSRSVISMALPSVLIGVGGGALLGAMSYLLEKYFDGLLDIILMTIMDIAGMIPSLITTVIIAYIFNQRMDVIIIAYGIFGIPFYARVVRDFLISRRTTKHTSAEEMCTRGEQTKYFLTQLHDFLRYLIPIVILDIGFLILNIGGLDFLGFGDPNVIAWGYDMGFVRSMFFYAPWTVFWPGLGLFVTVFGFLALGDDLMNFRDSPLRRRSDHRIPIRKLNKIPEKVLAHPIDDQEDPTTHNTCPDCGRHLDPIASFCPDCGIPL